MEGRGVRGIPEGSVAAVAAPVAPVEEESLAIDEEIFGTFHVGQGEFAIRAEHVREVVAFPEEIIPVPSSPSCVTGIFSLRGEVVPVVETSRLLGLPHQEAGEERKIAIVSGGDAYFGLVFDRSGEVLRLTRDDVVPMELQVEDCTPAVEGVLQVEGGERLVQILSLSVLDGLPRLPSQSQELRGQSDISAFAQCIVARFGSLALAFPIEGVLEVQEGLEITPGDAYFQHCRGIVQVRGESRGVLDLSEALGVESTDEERRFLFLCHDGASVAVEPNRDFDILEYAEEDCLELPELPGSQARNLLRGMIPLVEGGHALVVDIPALFERFRIAVGARVLSPQSGALEEEQGFQDAAELSGFFSFRIDDTLLSFALEDVLEVCELPEEILPAGGVGGEVFGLMDLRGRVVPLLDISTGGSSRRPGNPVLVVEFGSRVLGW